MIDEASRVAAHCGVDNVRSVHTKHVTSDPLKNKHMQWTQSDDKFQLTSLSRSLEDQLSASAFGFGKYLICSPVTNQWREFENLTFFEFRHTLSFDLHVFSVKSTINATITNTFNILFVTVIELV